MVLRLPHAAGADHAKVLVLALNDHEQILEIVNMVKKHYPHLKILARTEGRTQAYELLDSGVDHVYRETLDTSLRAGSDALPTLGFRAYHAHRATKTFRFHDEESIHKLRHLRHDRKSYISQARQGIEDLEEILLSELKEAAAPNFFIAPLQKQKNRATKGYFLRQLGHLPATDKTRRFLPLPRERFGFIGIFL